MQEMNNFKQSRLDQLKRPTILFLQVAQDLELDKFERVFAGMLAWATVLADEREGAHGMAILSRSCNWHSKRSRVRSHSWARL
jgi:hypothetical protein